MRCLAFAGAAALMLASGAVAVPPPVAVTGFITAPERDRPLAADVETLIGELGDEGYFALSPAGSAQVADDCMAGYAVSVECLVGNVRRAALPDLVIVLVERSLEDPDGVRIACVGQDPARSQHVEISLGRANGADATERRQHRTRLSSCMIGALHAPPRAAATQALNAPATRP